MEKRVSPSNTYNSYEEQSRPNHISQDPGPINFEPLGKRKIHFHCAQLLGRWVEENEK